MLYDDLIFVMTQGLSQEKSAKMNEYSLEELSTSCFLLIISQTTPFPHIHRRLNKQLLHYITHLLDEGYNLKLKTSSTVWGFNSVAEHLPGMHKVLGLIFSTAICPLPPKMIFQYIRNKEKHVSCNISSC